MKPTRKRNSALLDRDMIDDYQEIIALVGGLHRIGFHLIQKELCRIGVADLSNAHAFILMNIPNDRRNSLDEIRNRTNYVGSNMIKIIEALTSSGYITRERSSYDRRVSEIWLSKKGKSLCNQLVDMCGRRIDRLLAHHAGSDLRRMLSTLHQVEDLLIDQVLDH